MAGNTRGKVKEQLEGCHRNLDWFKAHIEKLHILIKEHNPRFSNAIDTCGKTAVELDKAVQSIYAEV